MLAVFTRHRTLSVIFLSLLLLSIVCQIIIGVIYQRLIKETDNMSSTENRLLKQFKLKFGNCYKLNGGVSNIPVFVDRFLGKISVMKMTLTGLQHLSGQLMLLSVAVAGVGACREIIRGETVGKILPYYIVSFLGLYVWFAVSGLVDIQGKKERLKVNLIDYLENHMVNKLRQSEIDWLELTEGETGPEKIKKEAPSKENLREKIGLSPVRDTARTGMADRSGPYPAAAAVKAGRKEASDAGSDLRTDSVPAFTPESRTEQAGADETGDGIFSRQEEQELEELLREFFA